MFAARLRRNNRITQNHETHHHHHQPQQPRRPAPHDGERRAVEQISSSSLHRVLPVKTFINVS